MESAESEVSTKPRTGSEVFLRAVDFGGCAAQLSKESCHKVANDDNIKDWRALPDGFRGAKCDSGACCINCIFPARKKALEDQKKPEPRRSKRFMSPGAADANVTPSRAPAVAKPRRARRNEIDALNTNMYRQDAGRESAPVNYEGAPAVRENEEMTECPPPPPRRVVEAPAPAAPRVMDAPTETTRSWPGEPDWWPLKRNDQIAGITDVKMLQKMIRHALPMAKKSFELKKELAAVKEQLAAALDEKRKRAEQFHDALREEPAVAERRARAKFLLAAAELHDFPELHDKAICDGTLDVMPGTKRIQAVVLSDGANNMQKATTNLFRYHRENEEYVAAISLQNSAAGALAVARGPHGQGGGTSAPKVKDPATRINSFAVPSPSTNRATVRNINPEDDGATGIFEGKIAAQCAHGKPMIMKMDGTDMAPKLREKKTREDGKPAFVPEGDVDESAYVPEDPEDKGPAYWKATLTDLCGPASRLGYVAEEDGSEVTFADRGAETPAALLREFKATARRAQKLVREAEPAVVAQVAQAALDHEALKAKFTVRQRGRSLHWTQHTELMGLTARRADALALREQMSSFVDEVDGLLRDDEHDELEYAQRLLKVARLQIDVVTKVSRLFRRKATKLMAVFLHSLDHSSYACIARFFYSNMNAEKAKLLVEKIRDAVARVPRGPDAPAPALYGVAADGEFSYLVNGDDKITNLSQLADAALDAHSSWASGEPYLSATTGRAKCDALHGRWRELALRRRAPALELRPTIMGFGPPLSRAAARVALERWRRLRLKGRKPRERMGSVLDSMMKERCLETLKPVLYAPTPTDRLPADEQTLLHALRALAMPEAGFASRPLIELASKLQLPDTRRSRDFFRRHSYEPSNEELLLDAAFLAICADMAARRRHAAEVSAMRAECERLEMDILRRNNPDLGAHYYAPEIVDGKMQIFSECFDHKLKTMVYGVMNQESTPADCPLSKERCLETARGAAGEQPCIIAEGVMLGAYDKQWDKQYRALIADERFKRRLLERGHIVDCLVLDIILEHQESFSLPGLTSTERAIRRYHFCFLNFALWGEEFFLPSKNRGDGFKARRGLTPLALLAMHANADGVTFLLDHLPAQIRDTFVERCLSNVPDLECYFGLLAQKCGYKAPTWIAEGCFRRIDALAMIKSAYDKSFSINESRHKHYSWAELSSKIIDAWNNGACLDPAVEAYLGPVAKLIREVTAKLQPKVLTVRSVYNR